MANKTLALNIEKTSVAAVLTEKTGEVTEILACGFAPLTESLSESLKDVLGQLGEGTTGARSILSIGGDVLGFHTLKFPFTSSKKIEQVIEIELEEQTSFDLESQAYDFITSPDENQGCNTLVTTINKDFLLSCITTLQSAGHDPEIITVSGPSIAKKFIRNKDFPTTNNCHIHLLDDRAILMIVQEKVITAIRHIYYDPSSQDDKRILSKLLLSAELYQTIRQTLLTYQKKKDHQKYNLVISGDTTRLPTPIALDLGGKTDFFEPQKEPFIKISAQMGQQYIPAKMNESLALATMSSSDKKSVFNFRKGSLARASNQWFKGRFAYAISITLLVSSIILGGWAWSEHQNLTTIKKQLHGEILTVFSETLPDVHKIIDPVQQLQVHVNSLQKLRSSNNLVSNHSMRTVLSQLSSGISPEYTVTLSRIIADDTTIRIKGIAKDFNTVDNIQKDLKKLDFFDDATISSANLNSQADNVRFELKLNYVLKP